MQQWLEGKTVANPDLSSCHVTLEYLLRNTKLTVLYDQLNLVNNFSGDRATMTSLMLPCLYKVA